MALTNERAARAGAPAAIERIVDTLAASRIKSAVAIVIVALACFLPGFNTLPPIDRDEARTAVATRAMEEIGSFAAPPVGDTTPVNTPVGINWLQAAVIAAIGEGADAPIWAYRLPSLGGCLAAALLTWWMALAFGRPRAALLAGLLFSASVLVVAEAHIGRANGVALAFIVLALGALARASMREADAAPGFLLPFLFWTGTGLAILFGGVFGPLIIAFSVASLSLRKRGVRWLGGLAPFPGIVWALILVSPWLAAIASFWSGKGTDPSLAPLLQIATDTSYPAPPGSYLLVSSATIWPLAAYFLLAIPWVLDNAKRRPAAFLLAAAIPYWLFLEAYPIKNLHYFLPVMAPLAVLAGLAIDEGKVPVRGAVRWLVAGGPFVWPLLLAGIVVVNLASGGNSAAYRPVPAFILSIAAGWLAARWLQSGRSPVASSIVSVVSALFLSLGLGGFLLPSLDIYRVAERTVAAGKAALDCPNPRFASVGFGEPSLVFAAGLRLQTLKGDAAADFLAAGPCRAAFVERRRQSLFAQRAEDLGLETEVRGDIHGVNIGDIKRLRVRVVVAKEPSR
jgi:4-amino-4-deoxy-L-arabinose transferase-like glycosyltransferase